MGKSDLFGALVALALIGMAIDIYFQPDLWPRKAPNVRLAFAASLIELLLHGGYIQTINGFGALSPRNKQPKMSSRTLF